MIKNAHRAFICRDQPLTVENNRTAWTTGYEAGQVIRVPLKNQDGQYVADERTLAQLEDEGRVVFRYAAGATHGPAGFEQNPNGSRHDIAGVTNAAGNVVGLMPHPEHAVEPGFGPDEPGAGTRTGTDGLTMFSSVLRAWWLSGARHRPGPTHATGRAGPHGPALLVVPGRPPRGGPSSPGSRRHRQALTALNTVKRRSRARSPPKSLGLSPAGNWSCGRTTAARAAAAPGPRRPAAPAPGWRR